MKIVIKNIKTIEEGREIGQTLFIRANSKQIEKMSSVINNLTELIHFDSQKKSKKKRKE